MKKIIAIIFIIAIIVGLTTWFIIANNTHTSTYVPSPDRLSEPSQTNAENNTNVEAEENNNENEEQNLEEETLKDEKLEEDYVLTEISPATNGLSDFDLSFLKVENKKENMVYSPLSIKYALKMLEEGANGETKNQITKLIGNYTLPKYKNSKNMSLANSFFIKDTFKDRTKQDYIDLLKSKYDADVIFDTFESEENINNWIKEKTLDIIPKLLGDREAEFWQFALINALAIDMEWEEFFLDEDSWESQLLLDFPNEILSSVYKPCEVTTMRFEGDNSKEYSGMWVNAVVNNYDIVKELGEDTIKKTLEDAYWKQLEEPHQQTLFQNTYPDISQEQWIKDFEEDYIKTIDQNYHKYASSTEFSVYSDDEYLLFGKDLKEYDGARLQYIGIMPRNMSLDDFTKNANSDLINELIGKMKTIEPSNFKEGVATVIRGTIPKFKFNYSLNFLEDLQKLGIKDVFDSELADLTNISNVQKGDPDYYNIFIQDAKHVADIDFSQKGIKAAAVTLFGGGGGGGEPEEFEFYYSFEVPTEEIDLDFNKPYAFLIRDKDTNKTWFVGTVYQPRLFSDEETDFGGGV